MTAGNIDEVGKRGKCMYYSFGSTFKKFLLSRKADVGSVLLFWGPLSATRSLGYKKDKKKAK
jgi:hypothetical protein